MKDVTDSSSCSLLTSAKQFNFASDFVFLMLEILEALEMSDTLDTRLESLSTFSGCLS